MRVALALVALLAREVQSGVLEEAAEAALTFCADCKRHPAARAMGTNTICSPGLPTMATY